MPPPLPPAAPASAIRSDSIPRTNNHNHTRSNHGFGDYGRLSPREQPQPAVDVRINDLVGNGISGRLYKWVNYGKGWRPRWLVLRDGVLSYYKIRGPDKIVVNKETEKGSKVIGEESMRRISRNRNSYSSREQSLHRRKPLGEIHLKVSTIRESRSDDKRFSIFTGIKRIHFWAETREDRVAWVEVLQAVKDMLSNGEYVTENVDLENTVVDESQRQSNDEDDDFSRPKHEKFSEISASESEDYNERNDAAEEETDDDDDAFFDALDFLSSSSFKSNGSDYKVSSFSSDDEGLNSIESEEDVDPSIRSAGASHPYVKRRKKLPDPTGKKKGVSLWSMIKDNIGKDLTKVYLPVYFNELLSSLQKCFEEMEYSYLLDRAYEWGKRGNSLMRVLNVAAFAASVYASTEGRICKPFNPLLGETYEADDSDKGLHFFSEKENLPPIDSRLRPDQRYLENGEYEMAN